MATSRKAKTGKTKTSCAARGPAKKKQPAVRKKKAAAAKSVVTKKAKAAPAPKLKTKPKSTAKPKVVVEKKPKPPPAAKPKLRKPKVDPELQKRMREALVGQRQRLMSVVQATQAQMAQKVGDLADVSDRASEGYGDELAVGLMAIEAAQLEDIESAIRRIDEGTYGLCADCGKPIPRKRLEVLPFVQHCLTCKGLKERNLKTGGGYADDEDGP